MTKKTSSTTPVVDILDLVLGSIIKFIASLGFMVDLVIHPIEKTKFVDGFSLGYNSKVEIIQNIKVAQN